MTYYIFNFPYFMMIGFPTRKSLSHQVLNSSNADGYITTATPPAARIASIFLSCSSVDLPLGPLVSIPTKRPLMQHSRSGMPGVVYFPPPQYLTYQAPCFLKYFLTSPSKIFSSALCIALCKNFLYILFCLILETPEIFLKIFFHVDVRHFASQKNLLSITMYALSRFCQESAKK